MSYYRFRLFTDANIFEADCFHWDDADALNAADNWVADVDSVEIWDGHRRVALVQKNRGAMAA